MNTRELKSLALLLCHYWLLLCMLLKVIKVWTDAKIINYFSYFSWLYVC